jgi:hypothetical protein
MRTKFVVKVCKDICVNIGQHLDEEQTTSPTFPLERYTLFLFYTYFPYFVISAVLFIQVRFCVHLQGHAIYAMWCWMTMDSMDDDALKM